MKILVTGNQGYIGSILVDMLMARGHEVTGLDIGYYKECLVYPYTPSIRQIVKDIRDVGPEDMEGIDAVIHLAALSNDPLGELVPGLTEEINLAGTIKAAQSAKQAGVKRFIFSSSPSMYGISTIEGELEEDNSEKHPLTAYARTKWEAECALKKMATADFHPIFFRPATVYGASPRLRCDVVYNNFVACAYTTGRIEIKSDGTPWRPLAHVSDICRAFIAGIDAPLSLVSGQAFNVGVPNGNYTVREVAQAAHEAVPGSTLTFTGEHGADSRSYKVSFNKILTVLKDHYKPEWNLERAGKELVALFKKINFTEADFRGRNCTRLAQIKHLQNSGSIDAKLRRTALKEAVR